MFNNSYVLSQEDEAKKALKEEIRSCIENKNSESTPIVPTNKVPNFQEKMKVFENSSHNGYAQNKRLQNTYA